jgi:uncharacterized MAPEG superfamily protein
MIQMTPELTALALAGLLHIAQFSLASYMANRDLGPRYTMGTRDGAPTREMRTITARMLRAYDNHVQMLGLFGLGAVIIAVTGQSTGVTATAAYTYLVARLLYIPAYAFGWTPARSYIWAIALICCATLLLVALF